MPQPHSNCLICGTLNQEFNINRCSKCKWPNGINDSLDSEMQGVLLKWAKHYYKLTVEYADELNRDEYSYMKLEGRLNRQRDDIDYIKKTTPQILMSIEEIKSILITKKSISGQDSDIPVKVANFINDNGLDETSQESKREESTSITENNLTMALEDFNSSSPELTKSHQEIVSQYYHNLSKFASKYQVKAANVTKDSINSNRGNEEKFIILEETLRGNYWVFDSDGYTYLVPAEGKYINQHSYTTISKIFEGNNYTPDYQKIQLMRPAIVITEMNTNPQTWRLQETGELEFS